MTKALKGGFSLFLLQLCLFLLSLRLGLHALVQFLLVLDRFFSTLAGVPNQ